jgi:hypothetical protein
VRLGFGESDKGRKKFVCSCGVGGVEARRVPRKIGAGAVCDNGQDVTCELVKCRYEKYYWLNVADEESSHGELWTWQEFPSPYSQLRHDRTS